MIDSLLEIVEVFHTVSMRTLPGFFLHKPAELLNKPAIHLNKPAIP
jgi:hypothetical protein